MIIDVLTLFPDMFAPLQQSILGRAQQSGLISLYVHDIRAYSENRHRNTDDYPFGGGAGMLMTPQPVVSAVRAVTGDRPKGKRIYLSPRGKTLTQAMARSLAKEESLLLLCGHYEGVDQRALELCIDEEISIGDYVLTGGELAAMVLVDCVARMIPGVLGSDESSETESFSMEGLLEYPQYTRPREFEGMEAPEVLLNGNHADIQRWRREQALCVTLRNRPDLLKKAPLTREDEACLQRIRLEDNQ